MEGVITCCQGDVYTIVADGAEYLCHLRGHFKTADIKSTNPIAVGDFVTFTIPRPEDGDFGWITAVADRRNYIVRKSVNLSKQSHILAANLDRAILLVTINYPITGTTFIDRFLATAQAYDVETILVFNKIDRYSPAESEEMARMQALYESIGYRCLVISAREEVGIDELRQEVAHGVTASSSTRRGSRASAPLTSARRTLMATSPIYLLTPRTATMPTAATLTSRSVRC